MSAAAAPAYAFIKRVGDAGEAFAEVELLAGDTVARLAARACALGGWGPPTRAHLHLVAAAGCGDEPSAAAESAALASPRLQAGWLLAHAGVAPGSWLLAAVSTPPAAGDAGTGTAAGGAVSKYDVLVEMLRELPARFHAFSDVGGDASP
jgi:hypothetical protein